MTSVILIVVLGAVSGLTGVGQELASKPRWGGASFGLGHGVLWVPQGEGTQVLTIQAGFNFTRPMWRGELEFSPTVGVVLNWRGKYFAPGVSIGMERALLFSRGDIKLGPVLEGSVLVFPSFGTAWGLGLQVDFKKNCQGTDLASQIIPSVQILYEVQWQKQEGVGNGIGLFAAVKFCSGR